MITLDWSSRGMAAWVGDPKPCRRCGHNAILREPGTADTPLHKVCAERELNERGEALSERAA